MFLSTQVYLVGNLLKAGEVQDRLDYHKELISCDIKTIQKSLTLHTLLEFILGYSSPSAKRSMIPKVLNDNPN